MAEDRTARKLAVVLHADVVGSTSLVRQNEQIAHERIHDAFRRFSECIDNYGGIPHELRGDALLAEFSRASDAVSAALAFQQSNTRQNEAVADDIAPEVRVGISLGEVVIADKTLTGPDVVLAQRLEQLADPGGVCISIAVQQALPERLPFDLTDLGEQEFKGFDDPVRAYKINLKGGAPIPIPELVEDEPAQSRKLVWSRLAVGLIALLVIIGGGLVWWQPWQPREEPASVERMAFALPDKPSIAVLPFDNLGGDPAQEILSDGLTNDIITELSKFKHIFVIASNSTFTYKGIAIKVQQVAEDLGVRYILEGSMQRTGETLRINAQLIDATTGHHLWAERYDRSASEFFVVQEDILRTIVASLASEVTKSEFERALSKPTGNLAAYDYYQRGRKAFRQYTKEANNQALELVEKAIDLEPDYARAYALLTWIHANNSSGRYRWGADPERSMELVLEVAQKAVELDPDDYYTHWALGFAQMTRGDFDRAEAAFNRALLLNPNDALLLATTGEPLYKSGKAEQAIAQMKLAMRINPHHPDWYFWDLGLAQYINEQYEDALATLNKMSKPPNGSRRTRAAVLVRLGRVEEAREVMSKFIETDLDMTLEEMEAFAWKDREGLARWIEDLRAAGLPEKRPLSLPDKPSIAVLPFDNLSNDPEQEYFVDGIAEDLITDLSKISGLFVIARNSSFAYKGKSPDLRQVSRELGVKYVLEGSVRRAGSQVRINAQLIDANSGGYLWAERYDGSLRDIFALQDQVTKQIVAALEVSLTDAEDRQQARRATNNSEAHDAFLQGWAYFKLGTPEDLTRAIPHFEKAIGLDGSYVQAHASLASIYWDAYVNDWAFDLGMPSFRAEDRANKHLEEALKAPTPMAHALHSRMLASRHFYDDALSEAKKGVALDSNDASGLEGLVNILLLTDRPAEAAEFVHKAMRLDPHSPPTYLTALGRAQFAMGRLDDAAVTFNRVVKRNIQSDLLWIYLAATYGHMGRITDGDSAIETANKLRSEAGMIDVSLRHLPYHRESDFRRFGGQLEQERVRAGLAKLPTISWTFLVTGYGSGAYISHAFRPPGFDVEGATKIDVPTAKSLYDRGVSFIDVRTESVSNQDRIPGAFHLPESWPTDPAKARLRESTLMAIVGKTDEVVFYCDGADCYPAAFASAKAVAWGYRNVSYFADGLRGWKEAGYPVEVDE